MSQYELFNYIDVEKLKHNFSNEEIEYIKSSNYLLKWAFSYLSGENINYEMWGTDYDMKILNKIVSIIQ